MTKISASLLLRVNPFFRRPSVGWGLSRLSFKHSASWPGGMGPSLRWGDDVCSFEFTL